MLASLGAAGTVMALSSHFACSVGIVALGGALAVLRRHQLHVAARQRQELSLRKELLAYLLFNGSPRTMAAADLGRQISRLVAVRSSFGRAALMLRDEVDHLCVAGSAGFDDLSVDALNRWGRGISDRTLSVQEIAAGSERVATSSFTLKLDRRCGQKDPLSTMNCCGVHIVPLRTAYGMVGALVVCTSARSPGKGSMPHDAGRPAAVRALLPLADLLQPLEALALRLTMQLAAPENVTSVWSARPLPRQERHMRSMKPRERQPGSAEASDRRALDKAAAPLGNVSTSTALERVRQILDPAAPPLPCVAGVSGRPPARVWR